MKIGELAERTGVPQRMLRYYEEQGLLSPGRGSNGYRAYAEPDVERVLRVRALIRAGLPSRLARVVLEMERDDTAWTTRCDEDFARDLARELAVIDEKLTCLQRSRETVATYLVGVGHPELIGAAPQVLAPDPSTTG